MQQPSFDRELATTAPESGSSRQALTSRQVESRVVTETDFSHRFPISRVRWRPPVPAGGE